jgi:hypothetical protein
LFVQNAGAVVLLHRGREIEFTLNYVHKVKVSSSSSFLFQLSPPSNVVTSSHSYREQIDCGGGRDDLLTPSLSLQANEQAMNETENRIS